MNAPALNIVAAAPVRQHFTGFILATIRRAMRGSEIAVDYGHQNGSYGVHQARVRLADDPTAYRLILAPADAPITINGRPIDEHFAAPLCAGAPVIEAAA